MEAQRKGRLKQVVDTDLGANPGGIRFEGGGKGRI